MHYRPVYSSQLSETKIKVIFRKARFASRVKCPRCHSQRCYEFEALRWRCRSCWYKFSLISGTFLGTHRFHLRFWCEIVWCFVLKSPAHRAHRLLGTKNYKTCLAAYQTIRRAIIQESILTRKTKFNGTLEVDESFFGGDFKNLRKKVRELLRKQGLAKRGRAAKHRKQPVFGIFKRNGQVYLEPIPDATAAILQETIRKNVKLGTEIFSDTWQGYKGLVGIGYIHRTVDHKEKEYVTGARFTSMV